MSPDDLKARIRTIPDWPEPGVQFRDITPLLRDGPALNALAEAFAVRYADHGLAAISSPRAAR